MSVRLALPGAHAAGYVGQKLRSTAHAKSARPSRRAFPLVTATSEGYIGRAQIPASVNLDGFKRQMFNWANTLTSSGQNLPLALPLKVDRTPDGFNIGLMRMNGKEATVVCQLTAKMEDNVFLVFEETESTEEFVDVPPIMASMANAIRRAVAENMVR
eukprot:jgi/Mesvir1/28170/Mv04730-RA.1